MAEILPGNVFVTDEGDVLPTADIHPIHTDHGHKEGPRDFDDSDTAKDRAFEQAARARAAWQLATGQRVVRLRAKRPTKYNPGWVR